MKKRSLGRGGPQVGAIGYGAMSLAGAYGACDPGQAMRILAGAVDLGMTHIDTARIYGMGVSEELVGRFLQSSPGLAQKVSIATKGGIETEPQRHFANSRLKLTEHLEGSLRRLGVDRIDLYYVHRRQQDIPIEDVAGTLGRFVEQGKIGGIGFSEIAPASLRRAHAAHPVAAVQSEYSLWTRMPELGLLQATAELGAAFVAFSPVGRGMFGDMAPDVTGLAPQDFRRANPRFAEPALSRNLAIIDGFRAFARARGVAPASLALAWVLSRGDHVIPIPGTRSLDHLRQNAAGAAITLSGDDLAEIDRLLPAGFAEGARYSDQQAVGVEGYC
jgi:aryl-alcohol dehydrogenase-like predicted oxidoreductase